MKPTHLRFPFALIITAAWLLGAAPPVNSQPAGNIPRIQMNDVPISTAISEFARQAGINYILDPKLFHLPNDANGNVIREPSVTLMWTNLSASNALAGLLDEQGFVMVQDKFTSVSLITGTNHVANIVDASLLGSDTNPASQMTNAPGLLIQFDMAPLDQALKNLTAHDHLDIALDPKVSDYVDPNDPTIHKFHNAPLVSVRWQNVTPRQAIVALCETYDLAIVKDAATGGVLIKPKD